MTASFPGLAVVTGIGCVNPFGLGGRALLTDILANNHSAIAPLTGFATAGLSRHLGAEVAKQHLPETEESRRWSRLSQLTVAACREAVTDAALSEPEMVRHFGLVVGTEFGDLQSTEAFALGFLRKGPRGLSPLLFPSTVMNAMAGTTSIALGLQGPMLTLNQPGIAGEVAVARAIGLLKAGRAPAVIVCGVDELFPLLYETLALLNVPSPRDGGEEACRPFDRRHNGPVLGEGATAVVLEAPEHAQARGAPILAQVHSALWGSLPAHPNRYPSLSHLTPALIDRTLDEAILPAQAVNVAYLSGSGDPCHDTAELALLTATFGTQSPLVTSVTHLTGEYGGLGTMRVAAAAVTATRGIFPSLTYLHQPLCDTIRFATPQTPYVSQGTVLVHGLARGGVQAAMLLGPPRAMQKGC